MAPDNPEMERRRLTEFYSHQMDGELEKVASQADELTPLARDILTHTSRTGYIKERTKQEGPRHGTAGTPPYRVRSSAPTSEAEVSADQNAGRRPAGVAGCRASPAGVNHPE